MSVFKVATRRGRASALRRAITADIAEGDVQEESWRFVEAIGFQEAEKMPLLYVVQADNGRIVAFEETRLTAASASLATASARPPGRCRAGAGYPLGRAHQRELFRPTLPLVDVQPLALAREERPQHGSVVDRPWAAIGAWLSGAQPSPDAATLPLQ